MLTATGDDMHDKSSSRLAFANKEELLSYGVGVICFDDQISDIIPN